MNVSEMINAINRRIDDSILNDDAIDWLNEGQNIMAIAIGAKFPQLSITDTTGTFVFDERYHTAPVMFASARYKEQDSSLQEAYNFMNQFETMKKEFVENYELPPRYMDSRTCQQFIATDQQTDFTITKPDYDPTYGDLKVYVNDMPVIPKFVYGTATFTIPACTLGDAVTAVWEEHNDMQEPPYPWWRKW